jgi:hypothetical protein
MSSKIRILAVRARRRFAGKRTTMRKALSCSPIFSVTPLARIGRRPRRVGSPRLEQLTDRRTSRHRRMPRRAVRVHGRRRGGHVLGRSQAAARPVMMTQAHGLNRAYYGGEITRLSYPAITDELGHRHDAFAVGRPA